MRKIYISSVFFLAALLFNACSNEKAYDALIITGQNNHNWEASSPVLKQILEETGMFRAEIMQAPASGGDMSLFNPVFSDFDLVVLDYSGDPWNDATMKAFTSWVAGGGAVVVYHAANNSFPEWKEYNAITGLGGWGNRNEKDGPYVYYKNNKLVTDTAAGSAGAHGERREFIVRVRNTEHPVTKGLPVRWMHAKDELYYNLRGPAENMEVLATAFADTSKGGGSLRDEPMLMAITYQKGRIFHTVLGHPEDGGGPAMQCTGFIVTLQRGAEWAVTGEVTQPVPPDFPTASGVVLRPDYKSMTLEGAYAGLATYEISKSTRSLTFLQSHIAGLRGDAAGLSEVEKKLTGILSSPDATTEGKKLVLRELSWMGTDYCLQAVKDAAGNADLKEEAEFALARLEK
jgi:type 1 glutamine amidotransferase